MIAVTDLAHVAAGEEKKIDFTVDHFLQVRHVLKIWVERQQARRMMTAGCGPTNGDDDVPLEALTHRPARLHLVALGAYGPVYGPAPSWRV